MCQTLPVLLFTQKKEFHAVKLFHSMKEDGIPPNYQTYAAMLYTYNKWVTCTSLFFKLNY